MKIRTLAVLLALLAAPAAAWAQEDDFGFLGDYREDAEEQDPVAPFVRTRAGGWIADSFDIDTITIRGPRRISGNGLVNLGADLGATVHGDWSFWASYDAGLSDETIMNVLGVNAGWTTKISAFALDGNPLRVTVSAGLLFGNLHVEDFNDFETAIGYRGGVAFAMFLPHAGVDIELYIDARWIEFDFRDQVLSGDESFGGGGVAVGLGFTFKI